MSRRLLLTGGTGFLGRHVIAAAGEDEVWSLGRQRPEGVPAARHLGLADAGDGAAIRRAVEAAEPDAVIHLAGAVVGDVASLYRVNVIFAAHLLDAAAARPAPPRVFLAGTATEYGPGAEAALPVTEETPAAPRSAYGISKYAQTLHGLAAAERGLGVVVGRIFNAIGAGMPEYLALGAFAAQVAAMGREGGVLVTGDLDVERDFVEAEDAARLILALATRGDAAGIVDICSGQPTGLRGLVEEMIRQSGRPITLRTDPARHGISPVRRHHGAARRLRALGLTVPVLDPARAMRAILRGAGALPGS